MQEGDQQMSQPLTNINININSTRGVAMKAV